MKVIVGSLNAPKRMAVEAVFSRAFPREDIVVECATVDSGVRAHPLSLEETMTGAKNRATKAKELVPDADYYVGIEGGLFSAEGRTWEIGFVVVMDAHGAVATGTSAGIEVRGALLQALQDGVELSSAVENKFGVMAVGKTNGFYGLATSDLVTRQTAYEQAVTFALAPFLHPELYVT